MSCSGLAENHGIILIMKSSDIRAKYIAFYKARQHAVIPSAPLIPENDPTTLFTSSGMQPLIPYLLGEPHPLGKRLVNSQKAIRMQDIEEVGDNRHTTFFEMLGNWSLGDYFKKEQLPWIFQFLTQEIGLNPQRLFVTVFEGNETVPKDNESIEIWKELFSSVSIDANEGSRIFTYSAKKNWWSRSGEPEKMPAGEPGGPDSEVFYDFGSELHIHESSVWRDSRCHPNCDCGRFMEIANSVFMQYQKQRNGSLVELEQKNVDFGGGLERIVAASQNVQDVFETDLFGSAILYLEHYAKKQYAESVAITKAMRIIADHIRGSIMLISDGVLPSNKGQGYILRRLIRRSLLYGRDLGLTKQFVYLGELVPIIAEGYRQAYPDIREKVVNIKQVIEDEANRFGKTLERGIKEIEKIAVLDGHKAFGLYETYGFPWEMTVEIATGRNQKIQKDQFEEEFKKHQILSRSAAVGMFKGGLQDHSVQTTKLHTATHLLHQALRTVLGSGVSQKGSNITVERLRFDFSYAEKMTPEQLEAVSVLVNEQIKRALPVSVAIMDKKQAMQSGALAFFGDRYGDQVKVYSIGDYSKEICGGPHVENTAALGAFRIIKEESAGAGIRRIYATVS